MTRDLSLAYDAWHRQFGREVGDPPPWHRLLTRHLESLHGCSVLEIGCGRGGLARWLTTQHPASLVAGDFSRAALEMASDLTDGQVNYEQADIEFLPHPAGSFDVVISCETIEHVPHPRRAVSELARVLKPDGRLYLTTPNYLNLMGLYRGYRRLRGRPFTEEGQPINNLTLLPRTVLWMKSAGLHPELIDACGHYVPVPGRNPPSVPSLDGLRPVVKWVASNQLLVATKRHRR